MSLAQKSSKAEPKEKLLKFGVSMAVVFGSTATGVKKPGDVDVAVFLNDEAKKRANTDFSSQFEVTVAIADFIGESVDRVDAVFVGPETTPLLLYHIARDGKLLFGSGQDFMRFRVFAVKVYQDAWKFREATRQYLKKAYA